MGSGLPILCTATIPLYPSGMQAVIYFFSRLISLQNDTGNSSRYNKSEAFWQKAPSPVTGGMEVCMPPDGTNVCAALASCVMDPTVDVV